MNLRFRKKVRQINASIIRRRTCCSLEQVFGVVKQRTCRSRSDSFIPTSSVRTLCNSHSRTVVSYGSNRSYFVISGQRFSLARLIIATAVADGTVLATSWSITPTFDLRNLFCSQNSMPPKYQVSLCDHISRNLSRPPYPPIPPLTMVDYARSPRTTLN